MSSRLSALLSVGAFFISALVALALGVSGRFAGVLAIVTALAIGGALLGFTRVADNSRDGILTPLLASIVLALVLATTRFIGDVSLFGIAPSDPWWFVTFAVVPLSTMLIGAYFVVRHTPLGLVLAWWSAIYVAADALLQVVHLIDGGTWILAGSIVALAQLVLAVQMVSRLLRPSVPVEVTEIPPMSPRRRNLWTILFLCAVVIYGLAILDRAGPLPVLVVVGSMMGGMIGWRLTTSHRPADPAIALPLFVLILALFYIHVGEEALTHFNRDIASISGRAWNDRDFIILFGLVGPIVWFAAALSLWKRQALGNFIFYFLVVGMIVGEPTHLVVFPVMRMVQTGGDYRYFSGMYTALFPMVPAILGLVATLRDHRRATEATR